MKNLLIALTACAVLAGCGGGGGSLGSGSLGGGSLGGSLGGSSGSIGSGRPSDGGSSAGSFGLFPNRQNRAVTPAQQVVLDHGDLVPVVADVRVDAVKAGAIIRVVAKASRQAYYEVRLRAVGRFEPDENGVITLELRARQPRFWTPASTERSREIVVGRFISSQKLSRTKKIIVIAAQNEIIVSR